MKQVVIGIIPTSNLYKTDNPYDDYYKFINLYAKKVYECQAIPIGILLEDGRINYDALKLCDGFLIQGGNKIESYIYEIIYYAIQKNIPLLGICMGAQAIAIFSNIYEYTNPLNKYSSTDIKNIYDDLKLKYNGSLLSKLPEPNIHSGHVKHRDNVDDIRHNVEIKRNTRAYEIYKDECISVCSLHNFSFKHVGKNFLISGHAKDGVEEIIEYDDPNYFIVGVHYHPELEIDTTIFEYFIKEAEKRKN